MMELEKLSNAVTEQVCLLTGHLLLAAGSDIGVSAFTVLVSRKQSRVPYVVGF